MMMISGIKRFAIFFVIVTMAAAGVAGICGGFSESSCRLDHNCVGSEWLSHDQAIILLAVTILVALVGLTLIAMAIWELFK